MNQYGDDWYDLAGELGDDEDTKDKGAKLAEAVQSAVSALDQSTPEKDRRDRLRDNLELFHGVKLTGLYQRASGPVAAQDRIAFNICYSIVSTMLNRITSFRVRAQFLPDGGDHKADKQARDMTAASDAWAAMEKYHRTARFSWRDMFIGGSGTPKMYVEKVGNVSHIRVTRFPSWEFMVNAAGNADPTCLYHVPVMPVDAAARKYEIDPVELRRYAITPGPDSILYEPGVPVVRVIDAYYRGPGGKRVVVCGPKATVEEWDYDGFPVLTSTFDDGEIGYWGTGAVEKLSPLQIELIKWQGQVRDAHDLTSQQVWQVQEGEAAPQKLNNATIRMNRYTNAPAQVINPAAINAEMYQYYSVLKEAGYEMLGVSQFVAAGVKQPGINSGEAIRESTEIQTDRLANLSQDWEEVRVDAATWWRRFAKEIVEGGEKLVYNAVRRGAFYHVELTPEMLGAETEIRVFPSSIFGQTVSGRLERAVELIDRQFLTKDDAMKALDMPDLEPIVDVALAEQYAREAIVDGILVDGRYVTPPEQMNPITMYEYAFKRYMLTMANPEAGYPAANLGKLKRLVSVMETRVKKSVAAQAAPVMGGPQAPPPGGVPMAVPGAVQGEATASAPGVPMAA